MNREIIMTVKNLLNVVNENGLGGEGQVSCSNVSSGGVASHARHFKRCDVLLSLVATYNYRSDFPAHE